MSPSVSISDSVLSVAALLRTGDVRAAHAQWRETVTSADEGERIALVECGRILTSYPRTADVHLRAYWYRASDERTRAVIEACAPRPGDQPAPVIEPQPDRAPRWDRRSIERERAQRRNGGEVTTEIRPERRRPRTQLRPESRAVTEYATTRAGLDDLPQRSEQPDGYAIDYERMAVNPVAHDRDRTDPRTTAVGSNGRPCVALGCNIEPSRADRTHHDGLCQECRELDRPGIQVPDNPSRAQMIESLCAYIWTNYPHPVNHLRTEWSRYSNQADRDTVAAWVAENVTEPTAAPDLDNCHTCGAERGPRDLRHQDADDGDCAECRAPLDTVPPPASPSSAADEPATEPASEPEPALVAA